jgi:hypothetical protein
MLAFTVNNAIGRWVAWGCRGLLVQMAGVRTDSVPPFTGVKPLIGGSHLHGLASLRKSDMAQRLGGLPTLTFRITDRCADSPSKRNLCTPCRFQWSPTPQRQASFSKGFAAMRVLNGLAHVRGLPHYGFVEYPVEATGTPVRLFGLSRFMMISVGFKAIENLCFT